MVTNPAYEIPLSNSQLAKIGRFIVLWNQAEMLLHHTVQEMLGLKVETNELVMGTTRPNSKMEIYNSVCSEKLAAFPALLVVGVKATREMSELVGFRNDLAHARWWDTKDLTKGFRRMTPDAKPVEIEKIDEKTDALAVVTNRLVFVLWEVWRTNHPDQTVKTPDKWREIGLSGIAPPL